jgi:iron complex outermembrane receptor protein
MRRSALQLAGVQITASPVGSDPREVPQSTIDLNGQALSRQLGSTLAQTLSAQPGVSVRFSGPAATAPVIRGLQGERVLVLEDGNRAADLSSAAPDHGTSVDPLAAQRIEVVRGPASLLYGNQALGGVVNVITNDIPTSIPSHVEGSAAVNSESGTPGGAATAGLTVPVGSSFAIVAKGGGRHTDDLRMGGGERLANTFYRNYYGIGGFGFNSGDQSGGLAFREYQFQYGLPSAEGERSKIDGHRHELVGRTDLALNRGVVSSLRLNGTAQWYGHAEINQETGETNTSFQLETQTLDALARTQVGRVSGAVGASGLFKQYAALGAEALTPAANSNGVGAFLFEEIPLRDTNGNADALVPKLQLGGRYDVYRIDVKPGDAKFEAFTGRHTYDEASGSIGVSIPLNSAFTFAVNAARAFRAPSVEELSSNAFHEAAGTYDVGNPTLQAEINQGIESIIKLESHKMNGQVAGYWNAIQNYITPNIVKDTAIAGDNGIITVPLNRIAQGNARLWGFEGQAEAEVAAHVVLGAMGDMVRGQLTGSNEPLPFMPAARLGGSARWDDGRLSFGGEYRHAFEQNRVPAAVSAEDPSAIVAPAYNLVNLNAGWTVRTGDRVGSITLRADNIFDEKYIDATSRLKAFAFNPGRNFSIVYKVLF